MTWDNGFGALARCAASGYLVLRYLRAAGASGAPTQYRRASQKNSHPLPIAAPPKALRSMKRGVSELGNSLKHDATAQIDHYTHSKFLLAWFLNRNVGSDKSGVSR
jgi:hypothetical protein